MTSGFKYSAMTLNIVGERSSFVRLSSCVNALHSIECCNSNAIFISDAFKNRLEKVIYCLCLNKTRVNSLYKYLNKV